MIKNKKNQEENLFKELDKNKFRSSCSLPLIIITLVIIFLLCVWGLMFLKNNYSAKVRLNVPSSLYEIEDYDLTSDLNKKFEDKDPGEVLTFNIYEDEMLNYLSLNGPNFPLEDATLEIEEKGIIINGKTSEGILSFPVEVLLIPEVNDGKLGFKVAEANAGFVSLPKSIREALEEYTVNHLNNKLNNVDNIEYQSADTFTDYIKITAAVRQE